MDGSDRSTRLSPVVAAAARPDPSRSVSPADDGSRRPSASTVILEMLSPTHAPELLRTINLFSNFSFAFTSMNVLSSVSILYSFGLRNGGPAVIVWGWLVGATLSTITGLCLAEICSVFPQAGGVYQWAGQLAPPEYAPFWTYATSWMIFLGNTACAASYAYGFANVIAAAYHVYSNTSLSTNVQAVIAIGTGLVWGAISSLHLPKQSLLHNFATIFQMTSTIGIIVAISSRGPSKQSAEFVFGATHDGTGFNSIWYAGVIGILMSVFGFSGYDSGTHLAEETLDASVTAPRGIVATCLSTGVVGLAYLVGLLYSTDSIDAALATPNAAVYVFTLTLGSTGGFVLALLLAANLFFGGASAITCSSRIAFAMARDQALPSMLAKVNPVTNVPLMAVWFVSLCVCTMQLLVVGSTVAFMAITSISNVGFQLAYAFPIMLRLYTFSANRFQQGGFSLGRWALPCCVLAALWLMATTVICFLPQASPATPDNLNYSIVVVGGICLLGVAYWQLHAKTAYHKPDRPS